MKIMMLDRLPGSPVVNPPEFRMYPSTAVIHVAQPFFVPDYCAEWEARAGIALRLCRLGKSVDEKFAPRYYDAMAPIVMFRPVDFEREPRLSGLVTALDSTVALGPWQALPEAGEKFSIEWNGLPLTTSFEELRTDASVAVISRYCMLQMGDVVVPAMLPMSIPVKPDTGCSLTIGSGDRYEIRVK